MRQKDIANLIGVNKSTISRELKRNATEQHKYIWLKAQKYADERKKRTANNKISDEIKWQAIELLKNEQWSPQQISGYLKLQGISISHKTIYQIIHNNPSLICHCRHL